MSTAKQDLERQVDALQRAGIAPERICLDKKSGASTDRPGLRAALEYARDGDVIVVHTSDRLGRTVRDTLNLIHELAERGVGLRDLADPIRVDSSNPSDPMAQLAVVLLALFGQMERTYMLERVAHARAVATAKGRRIGRPSVVDADKLAYAVHLRDAGHTLAEIVAETGITRTTLYRHLPARPAPLLTAAAPAGDVDQAAPGAAGREGASLVGRAARDLLEAVDWPDTYRPSCPVCAQPVTGLQERYVRRAGVREPVVVALACPCGCDVDQHVSALQAAAPADDDHGRATCSLSGALHLPAQGRDDRGGRHRQRRRQPARQGRARGRGRTGRRRQAAARVPGGASSTWRRPTATRCPTSRRRC